MYALTKVYDTEEPKLGDLTLSVARAARLTLPKSPNITQTTYP